MRSCYHAERFIEKPDRETAEQYLAQGGYLWNSGIFLVSVKKYLESLKQFEPEVWEACRTAIAQRVGDGIFLRPDAAAFRRSPSISIDYAVMERAGDVALVQADMGWSDLGSWQALSKVIKGGAEGNQVSGDVLLEEVEDSYVRSDGRLVAVLGMKDVVVVAQDDAILVGPKSRMQEVRKLTEKLADDKREEARTHLTQQRPWGQFHRIDKGANYQVKKLTLKPGGRISLQRHYHRAEHWIVVGGTALVTRGNEVFRLGINESTYIQPGMVHRLENREEEPLHLIEVQTGTYLGEDDIERLDDHYGRR
ncbi:MAG: mannose-1-phosphate guanylyltransferase/mannose-6-phosphate isomerase [Alphaproteobacteria bacterium]|nr:mannose-1-phosphate guanylyltransferase/mannose-6-phosphate isomerase [Alphaproteobacteria bacterium]